MPLSGLDPCRPAVAVATADLLGQHRGQVGGVVPTLVAGADVKNVHSSYWTSKRAADRIFSALRGEIS